MLLIDVAHVDARTRRGIEEVFRQSFDLDKDPEHLLQPYFSKIESVLIAKDGERIVGFQFYQRKVIEGRSVHHFSLAGRLDDRRYKGLQARFGSLLIRAAIARTPPWRPIYLAGVTNSPRSYANMHAVGGRCFPDVASLRQSNPFGDWYYRVAAELGLVGVDHQGMLRDRMQNLGFALVQDERPHPMSPAYDRFVGGNRQHGVFTLIELLPIKHIPLYLLKRAFHSVRTSHPIAAEAR